MADVEETKADKFVRLKDARLTRVMDAIRILGNITNKRDYDYTEEQALEVVDGLYDRVDEVAEGFDVPKRVYPTPEPEALEADDLSEDLQDDEDENDDDEEVKVKQPKGRELLVPDMYSNIAEYDGVRLKVDHADWRALDLLRAGPRLGLALEAVMDGDTETAKKHLLAVMIT
jgi:hypothetical protein